MLKNKTLVCTDGGSAKWQSHFRHICFSQLDILLQANNPTPKYLPKKENLCWYTNIVRQI